MLTVVTGASGFVGQMLVRRMRETDYPGVVRLLDTQRLRLFDSRFEYREIDLRDEGALAMAVSDADRVIHLAALPGGAAQADPDLSRAINLDVPLNLMRLLRGRDCRLVMAGSIAVFGAPIPASVEDDTATRPTMTYGVHKLMTELALTDAVRRGDVHGTVLRLPGIVARPDGGSAFKSAFLNNLFWAIRDRTSIELPVGRNAHSWLMSARACADAFLHAVAIERSPAVVTLPALRVNISELVEEVARQTAASSQVVTYQPDVELEAQFGAYPPLVTPLADSLGFHHDGGLQQLVARVLADAAGDGDRLSGELK